MNDENKSGSRIAAHAAIGPTETDWKREGGF